MEDRKLLTHIHQACAAGVELIPPAILCESIGSIGLKKPLCVSMNTSLAECIALLQRHRIGSLIVTKDDGRIAGIFTERDCVLKVVAKVASFDTAVVADFMTPDPMRELPDATLAYALNLMSNGGFRHVPIVDQDDVPIGMISVKDVVDYLVERMLSGILRECELELSD
jgi:CBS domain-containing protein